MQLQGVNCLESGYVSSTFGSSSSDDSDNVASDSDFKVATESDVNSGQSTFVSGQSAPIFSAVMFMKLKTAEHSQNIQVMLVAIE